MKVRVVIGGAVLAVVALVAVALAWPSGDDGRGEAARDTGSEGADGPGPPIPGNRHGRGDESSGAGDDSGNRAGRTGPSPGPGTGVADGGSTPSGPPAPSGGGTGRSPVGPDAGAGCAGPHLCVGAAARPVTPTEAHVRGVVEPRLLLGAKVQRFNLGGFGIDPLQSVPDPVGALGDTLTVPASATHYAGSQGREDTWVRAMVVQQPGGPVVAFVTLDAVGAGNVIQDRLTGAVSRATGIPRANVLFGQTHTHAGADLQGLWGGVPRDWVESILYPQAVAAVTEALHGRRPAVLSVRHGDAEAYNNYRRPKRIDPDIDTDTELTLLQATDPGDGTVVANLLQFNAHPTSVNEDERVPHPDYVLGALDWIERRTGGVALYYNGPIADASPAGERRGCGYRRDGAYGTVRCRGEGIAAAALAAPVDRVLEPTLVLRHQTVLLPVTNPMFVAAGGAGAFNRYYDFLKLPVADIPLIGEHVASALVALPQLTPTATTLVSRVTIGGERSGLEVVTLPGEATGTFGDFVRGLAAPGAHVMLLGLTHNSFGYLIPEEEFSYLDASGEAGFLVPFTGYEEFVSLGPLTAPLLRAQGYVPLFEADPVHALPPYLTACLDGIDGRGCVFHIVGRHLDYVQTELEANCRELGLVDAFCGLLNPETPLAEPCDVLGLPPGVCDLFRSTPRRR